MNLVDDSRILCSSLTTKISGNIKQVEFGGSVGFVFVYVCLAIPHMDLGTSFS